jgi:pyruvate dehydrogenase E1 component alpha subunit
MANRRELNIALYKKIYLMRRAEKRIQDVYFSDVMKTPVHLSLGEEAIVAGVAGALSKYDQVYGTCRGHALYLARSEDLDSFYGELCGRSTGIARGKAGSMHISYPEAGFIASSAIVASIIPVALGAAFSVKYSKKPYVVAVFFGDGATEEGVFWESLNMAALHKLPLLFICEDNGLAIHAKIKDRQSYSIPEAAKSFGLHVHSDDTTDPEEIYHHTADALKNIKSTGIPSFLHLKYHRYLEHVGVNEDYNSAYRGEKHDYRHWYSKDPLLVQRRKLIEMSVSEETLLKIEDEIENNINISLEASSKAPLPEASELYTNVYADE